MNTTSKQQKLPNRVKNTILKVSKFVISRALYLLLGMFISLCLVVAIVYVKAWTSPGEDPVSVGPGTPLTAALWNDHVNKLIDLNSRTLDCQQKSLTGDNFNGQTLDCDAGYTLTGGGCVWRSDGNDRYVYSKPNGNGWYCQNNDGFQVSEIWAICCRIN